jgi:hypothetical protein
MSKAATDAPPLPLQLPASGAALGGNALAQTLSAELAPLLGAHPLLTAAAEQGGRIDPASVAVSLLGHRNQAGGAELRIGVFCEEVIGGCSCGDPPHAARLYRQFRLQLRPDGAARLLLAPD